MCNSLDQNNNTPQTHHSPEPSILPRPPEPSILPRPGWQHSQTGIIMKDFVNTLHLINTLNTRIRMAERRTVHFNTPQTMAHSPKGKKVPMLT